MFASKQVKVLQSNPPNGSPDNGSIRFLVQVKAFPILVLSEENAVVSGSIRLLVQHLTGPDADLLSRLDCTSKPCC